MSVKDNNLFSFVILYYYLIFLCSVTLCDRTNQHSDLEFVAHTDEAEFAGLLFGVLGGIGVLK